jgi:hypothetical protein
MLPLFRTDTPSGPPTAFLTALNFAMGTYLTEGELSTLRNPSPVE